VPLSVAAADRPRRVRLLLQGNPGPARG